MVDDDAEREFDASGVTSRIAPREREVRCDRAAARAYQPVLLR